MSIEATKKAIGEAAAELIRNGMAVGLGTGTTTAYFIESLGERCRQGLKIHAIASSEASLSLARRGHIPLLDPHQVTSLDITVDGADEIDAKKQMIKGGGGALVREKIVAAMSRELVILVDETKLVAKLGKRPLPVEIIPFGAQATKHHLEKNGHHGKWRQTSDGKPYLTDNGNLILDIHFPKPLEEPASVHAAIRTIPGVVDTGFFFHLAGRVIVGFFDGQIVTRQ